MKRKAIRSMVSARLKKLAQYGGRISRDFSDEDIHRFRLEVKKLRALLRMLALEVPDQGEVKLPRKLKKIYATAGVVRDMHLHVQRMETAMQNQAERPEDYMEQLDEKARESKHALAKLLADDPFPRIEKKISAKLPDGLHAPTLEKFTRQKIADIATLIRGNHDEDEDIHTIRKHLKDLMYNARIFEKEAPDNFPAALVTEHQYNTIEQLAGKLGEYNDVCFATSFLDARHLRKVKKGEKKQLHALNEQWLQEKQKLRQATIKSLEAAYPGIVIRD